MALTKAGLIQPQGMTTVERDLLTLAGADTGRLIYNETTKELQQWTGSAWLPLLNSSTSIPGSQVTGSIAAAQLQGDIDGGLF
jgi:hypothetical protein